MWAIWIPSAWAETSSAAKPHLFEQLVPIIFIFLLIYLLLIRPAQKKQKQHQFLLDQLKKGDHVMTSSGILGTIHGLADHFVILEVAENVRIRIVRSQISSLVDSRGETVNSVPTNS